MTGIVGLRVHIDSEGISCMNNRNSIFHRYIFDREFANVGIVVTLKEITQSSQGVCES